MVRQVAAWPSLLFVNALLFGAVYGGLLRTFTPENPLTFALLGAMNAFLFLADGPTRWVRVTYRSASDTMARAYFAEASSVGSRRILADTRRFCFRIRAAVFADCA
jgi:hypothetical protein